MPVTRTPFDQAVTITAAVRDLDTTDARAALVVESLDWLLAHIRVSDDREDFASAVRSLVVGLSDSARHYDDRADTDALYDEPEPVVIASRETANTLHALTAALLERHH